MDGIDCLVLKAFVATVASLQKLFVAVAQTKSCCLAIILSPYINADARRYTLSAIVDWSGDWSTPWGLASQIRPWSEQSE